MATAAGAADDHAVAPREIDDALDPFGRHRLFRAAITDELDAREEPLAAHVAHPGIPQEGAEAIEEARAALGRALDQALREDDLAVAVGDRGGAGGAPIRRDLEHLAGLRRLG